MNTLAVPMPLTLSKKREANIREVDNGFIIRFTVINPEADTASRHYIEKELVVTNLSQLFKKLKLFFEPEIVEEEAI